MDGNEKRTHYLFRRFIDACLEGRDSDKEELDFLRSLYQERAKRSDLWMAIVEAEMRLEEQRLRTREAEAKASYQKGYR